MKHNIYITIAAILTTFVFLGFYNTFMAATNPSDNSGALQSRYRILQLAPDQTDTNFTVYRGDYIKFDLNGAKTEGLLQIPSLQISKQLTADLPKAPYFKMTRLGAHPYSIGTVKGTINVVEFEQAQYQKLTADEAAELIKNVSPVILDVRTPQEYSTGHLENSILLPVQELQQRYNELSEFKNKDVFIYCATGNRSTVAAKILIDNGFTRIYNLQNGISEWAKGGYPLVR